MRGLEVAVLEPEFVGPVLVAVPGTCHAQRAVVHVTLSVPWHARVPVSSPFCWLSRGRSHMKHFIYITEQSFLMGS